MENKNNAITKQETDFAQWYTDVCLKAELMDYSSVKGFIVYRPYGYAIWELIQKELDQKFKNVGVENVYMPMVIPSSLFQKEKDHVSGFAPETLIATIGGKNQLEDPLIIRPTSETLFCEHFQKVIHSYRDLPLRIAEIGRDSRFESSGSLKGIERVRTFCQNDSHIFCTLEQVEQELSDQLKEISK